MVKSALTLKLVAILWVIWGIVHVLAGGLTLSQDTASALKGLADAADPALLEVMYPGAAAAIINQHGFNLLWIGLFTIIGGLYIWKKSATAVFFTGIVGGLTDIGYFIFIDLGGYNNFVPGTVMTIISAAAILLSILAYKNGDLKTI